LVFRSTVMGVCADPAERFTAVGLMITALLYTGFVSVLLDRGTALQRSPVDLLVLAAVLIGVDTLGCMRLALKRQGLG
jgi:hypothetical protein